MFEWRRAALAAAIGLVCGLGGGEPASAQSLPPGSYLNSCSNARMVDNALVATCRTADQTPRESSLEDPFSCQGSIANRNGRLTCEARPAPVPAPISSPAALAKFEDGCDGDSWFVVRRAGPPGDALRFHLERHQKVHFELPEGSTYAVRCDRWPNANDAFRVVEFE